MQKKYQQIAEAIVLRIKNGDYAMNYALSDRKIAEEASVNTATARRAIRLLLENGILKRKSNGRLTICPDFSNKHSKYKFAFVKEGNVVAADSLWLKEMKEAASAANASFKTVVFDHVDDPVIGEALDGDFDLVFFSPFEYSETIIRKMVIKREKVVSLFSDYSSFGICSLTSPIGKEMQIIIDHLKGLGHEKIGFLNTAPMDNVISSRIDCFSSILAINSGKDIVINVPCKPLEDPSTAARLTVAGLVASGDLDFSAIVCSTMQVAFGAARGLHESGLKVGDEISLATIGNPETGRNYIPSITTTMLSGTRPVFSKLMESGKAPSPQDKLVYSIGTPSLITGESTTVLGRLIVTGEEA